MGGMELLIILAIILLFFGATRIPQLGRSLGQSVREFREGSSSDSDEELGGETKERKEIPYKDEDLAKDEEELSLNGVAHAESSRAEAEVTTPTEQKI